MKTLAVLLVVLAAACTTSTPDTSPTIGVDSSPPWLETQIYTVTVGWSFGEPDVQFTIDAANCSGCDLFGVPSSDQTFTDTTTFQMQVSSTTNVAIDAMLDANGEKYEVQIVGQGASGEP